MIMTNEILNSKGMHGRFMNKLVDARSRKDELDDALNDLNEENIKKISGAKIGDTVKIEGSEVVVKPYIKEKADLLLKSIETERGQTDDLTTEKN